MNITRIAWGAKVSPEFIDRVIAICRKFNWDEEAPTNLMSCMAFESAETFSPSIKNAAGSGATGLIQFMPATARSLGTSVEELGRMTAEAQLYYVERYFAPYAKRIASLSDMYMAILLPKYVGASDNAVLFSSGIAYCQNAGLDVNRDGKITKAEATTLVQAKRVRGLHPDRVLTGVWK